jgi:ferrous iron transport protein B
MGGYGVSIDASFASMLGKLFEPIFMPIGFTWQIVTALIFGFIAKEAVVQTLSIIYAVGGSATLAVALTASITPLSAFALMVFVLLYVPCLATIGAIRKETGSWKWTAFSITYQLILAYIVAIVIIFIGGFFIV